MKEPKRCFYGIDFYKRVSSGDTHLPCPFKDADDICGNKFFCNHQRSLHADHEKKHTLVVNLEQACI